MKIRIYLYYDRYDFENSLMTIVRAQDGEPVEVLIRKFNKKVQSDGVLNELKKREFYEKPSIVRKREEKERRRLAYNRARRGD